MNNYIYKMDLKVLNIVSIILMLLIGLPLFLLTYNSINDSEYYLIMLLFIPYCMIHEIVHSIAYVINGAKFKNIIYGMHLEKGVFCCLCKENVSKKNILKSLMAPFTFLGIITLILGFIIQNNILIWLSALNIMGCSGDLIMFFDFIRVKDFEYTEFDDPTAFALYGDSHLKEIQLFGLKYVEAKKEIPKTNDKKITISNLSIVFLIIYVIIIISNILLQK